MPNNSEDKKSRGNESKRGGDDEGSNAENVPNPPEANARGMAAAALKKAVASNSESGDQQGISTSSDNRPPPSQSVQAPVNMICATTQDFQLFLSHLNSDKTDKGTKMFKDNQHEVITPRNGIQKMSWDVLFPIPKGIIATWPVQFNLKTYPVALCNGFSLGATLSEYPTQDLEQMINEDFTLDHASVLHSVPSNLVFVKSTFEREALLMKSSWGLDDHKYAELLERIPTIMNQIKGLILATSLLKGSLQEHGMFEVEHYKELTTKFGAANAYYLSLVFFSTATMGYNRALYHFYAGAIRRAAEAKCDAAKLKEHTSKSLIFKALTEVDGKMLLLDTPRAGTLSHQLFGCWKSCRKQPSAWTRNIPGAPKRSLSLMMSSCSSLKH